MSSNLFLQDIHILLESQQYAILTENRIEFLKKNNPTIDTSHDTLALYDKPDEIINHFADVGDPTKNKQHTQWILGQYKKKNIRQEDMYRVRDALTNFDKYKSKLDKKDINQYKTLSELEGAVRPHKGTAATKKEETAQSLEKGHTLIHEGKDGTKVYRLERNPDGKKASIKIYGGGGELGGTHTSWCTAADSEYNMFDHYSKMQPLHVIHTADGEVYQAHPHTNQLMDRHDNEVMGEIEDDNRDLVPHKHAKEISGALDHIPGGGKLKVTKELPNASHKDLDDIISTPSDEVEYGDLKAAVRHPNITPDLLEKAFNKHYEISEMVLEHPKMPHHVLKNVMESASHGFISKSAAALNPSLPSDDVRKYYNVNTDVDVRTNLLYNNNTPKDVLKNAIDEGTPGEVHAALRHHNTDIELLRYGVNKHPKQVYAALHNPHVTPDIIDKGLEDKGWENQYGQQQAAEHPNASSENLHKALKSSVVNVRATALMNPNSDESHIRVGLQDKDHYVIGKALKHPLITSEHLHNFIMDSNGSVHSQLKDLVFSHPKLSADDLDKALNSKDPYTVLPAIRNKNTTNEQLAKLKDHDDDEVHFMSQRELEKRTKNAK